MSAISGANSVLQVLSSAIQGGLPFSSTALNHSSNSELSSLGEAQIQLQQSHDFFSPSAYDATSLDSSPTSSAAASNELDPASVTQNYLNLQSGYDTYVQANPSAAVPQTGSLVNVLG